MSDGVGSATDPIQTIRQINQEMAAFQAELLDAEKDGAKAIEPKKSAQKVVQRTGA